GIESYFVRAFQRANEIGDGILREDKATVHVIAGIKQDEDIGASKGRTKRFGPVFQRRAQILYPTAPFGGGGFVRSVLANVGSNVYQSGCGTIPFFKCGNLFWDAIFGDREVQRMKTRYIVALIVG